MTLTISVLIPSHGRPEKLRRCIAGLAAQRRLPDQVVVVWQGDDTATRDAAVAALAQLPGRALLLHNRERGIVPSENMALAHATGEVILLIDDDAVPPEDWVGRHVAHYADPRVGAVGGPADNHRADGTPFPTRAVEPVGRLTWFGRLVGNMHDQPASWRVRPPSAVDHLVGYNLSLRRVAFERFEERLLPYWQLFEAEACQQARARGYEIRFDWGNVVAHYPSNTVFEAGRAGDLSLKIYNVAYNHAFVLARHSPWVLRAARLLYLMLVGSSNVPGVLGFVVASALSRRPVAELRILWRTMRAHARGWRAGSVARRAQRRGGQRVRGADNPTLLSAEE